MSPERQGLLIQPRYDGGTVRLFSVPSSLITPEVLLAFKQGWAPSDIVGATRDYFGENEGDLPMGLLPLMGQMQAVGGPILHGPFHRVVVTPPIPGLS